MSDQAPIIINSSAKPDMTMTAVRDFLKVIGTALATHGAMSHGYGEIAAGTVWAVGPIIWSQLVTVMRSRREAAMAAMLPDRLAQVR